MKRLEIQIINDYQNRKDEYSEFFGIDKNFKIIGFGIEIFGREKILSIEIGLLGITFDISLSYKI